jgi:hypothetical protein
MQRLQFFIFLLVNGSKVFFLCFELFVVHYALVEINVKHLNDFCALCYC